MALVPEDGTGVANADSYCVDVAEVKTRAAKYGLDFDSTTDVAKAEQAAKDGTYRLDRDLESWMWGRRAFPETPQARAYPRTDFVDRFGQTVTEGTIPDELKDAQSVLAYFAQQGDALFIQPGVSASVSRSAYADDAKNQAVEYSGGSFDSNGQPKKTYPSVRYICRRLLFKHRELARR